MRRVRGQRGQVSQAWIWKSKAQGRRWNVLAKQWLINRRIPRVWRCRLARGVTFETGQTAWKDTPEERASSGRSDVIRLPLQSQGVVDVYRARLRTNNCARSTVGDDGAGSREGQVPRAATLVCFHCPVAVVLLWTAMPPSQPRNVKLEYAGDGVFDARQNSLPLSICRRVGETPGAN